MKRNSNGSGKYPEIFLAFGAASLRDGESAVELAQMVPAQIIKIGDDTNNVGHSALAPIALSGTLDDFFIATVLKSYVATSYPY